MKIVKPGWVNHDGKPIFSVDIHPDGSRFVTGGQGDDYGKIIIWNMAPVRHENQEKIDTIPKILCQMDNHYACVNCVRWSHSGKFLASGGDDKLVMIWQTSRGAGPSKAFGSSGSVVIHEQWRPVHTLRGHIGDVLDLNWSPQDVWLATCSVDNTIIIWNALHFPEQLATLKGHSGLVKGVTWDPVGKYLASQSDDRSLRIWRTMDWKQEACITEPFKECGGTTHSLRLNWSPDGHHVVSAHAMNNSGPTAQIIERQGFKSTLDFVGHRKAVTVVRFNPNMFTKSPKADKAQPYSCCAVGSKDRSVSIWLTCLKRPLVVMHELFDNSVLDLSWSKDGLELLVCSIDGAVALLEFDPREIGYALSKDDMTGVLESVYGKSVSLNMAAAAGAQIIESAAMLNLQTQNKQQDSRTASTPCKNSNSGMSQGGTPFKPSDKQIETRTADGRRRITPIFLAPQPELGEAPLPFSATSPSIGFHSSSEKSKIVVEKQNRVTMPGVMSPSSGSKSCSKSMSSPPPASQGNSSSSKDVIVQSTKPSEDAPSDKGAVQRPPADTTPEKAPTAQMANETTPGKACAPMDTSTLEEKLISSSEKSEQSLTPQSVEKSKIAEKIKDSEGKDPTSSKVKVKLSGSLSLKRKLDDKRYRTNAKQYGKRGRPTKAEQAAREAAIGAAHGPDAAMSGGHREVSAQRTPSTPVTAVSQPSEMRVPPARPRFKLPVLSLGKSYSKVLCESAGRSGFEEGSVTVEVDNAQEVGGTHLHRLRLSRGGGSNWEHFLNSEITAIAGSRHVVCAACNNGTVSVFSMGGRRLFPPLVIGSSVAVLTCAGHYIMAVSDKGKLFVWNCQAKKTIIQEQSLQSIMTDKDKLEQASVTSEGVPVVALDNKKSYCFSLDIGCWVMAHDSSDRLQSGSAHHSCTPSKLRPLGPLSTLQRQVKPSETASRSFSSSPSIRQTVTLSHLESQVMTSAVLKSGTEWRFWMETYIRYLAQEGLEEKLREVCDDLLGPVYKLGKSKSWARFELGVDKHAVLRSALPSIGSDLKFQRLYTEYKDQLDIAQTAS